MESHVTLSDAEFENQFAVKTLHAELFTHEAHLRLAWIHIQKYGVESAIGNLTSQIKNYANSLGAADKYHETVTIAAIRAVYHFMLRSTDSNFNDFIRNNPRLRNNFKELLNAHYTTDIFHDEHAKKNYLEPELLPFD